LRIPEIKNEKKPSENVATLAGARARIKRAA
jgi:hypothetical protein